MDYVLADVYRGLRTQALQLTAAQVGTADGVFGVLMELRVAHLRSGEPGIPWTWDRYSAPPGETFLLACAGAECSIVHDQCRELTDVLRALWLCFRGQRS